MPKVLDWQQDWPPISLACKHGNMDGLRECLAKNDALRAELETLSAEELQARAIADITEQAPKAEAGLPPLPVDMSALDAAEASESPRDATIQLILKLHKNDPNTANTRGSTCIMICAQYGTPKHIEMLKLLLQILVDTGRSDEVDTRRESDQQTAYHMACFWNKPDSAMALVEAGCDTGLPEKYGRCGRQMAEIRKLTDLIASLDAMGVEKMSPQATPVAPVGGGGQIIGSDAARAAGGEDEWGNVRPADETPEQRRARAKIAAEKVKIDQVAERMPLAAQIVRETSMVCHNVLNEPSAGLFHTHKYARISLFLCRCSDWPWPANRCCTSVRLHSHVRRTAGPIHETSKDLKHLNQECKQRCLDVDDITPLVNDISHMTHLTDLRKVIEETLVMLTPDPRRGR